MFFIIVHIDSGALYMSSSVWLLVVVSCAFPQAEKERTASKTEKIQKTTTIFTQNGPRLRENKCHFVNFLSFASSSFFLNMRKITWLNSQQPKTRGHVEHHSKVCIIRLVHIFKKKSSSTFWQVHCCSYRTRRSCQKYNEDFFKFCGLLRKPKLY